MLKIAILDDYQNVAQDFVDLKKLSIKYEIKIFSEAFENEDTKSARKIFKKDKLLNHINADASNVIINNINKYDNDMLLYLLSTVRKIERAGDSIKNIGEEIIFHIDAKSIKHKKKS